MPISPRHVGSAGGQIGSGFAASLTASRLSDTGISLPSGGWIRLIGSVAAGAYFAVSIPVALLSGLTEAAADDDLTNTAPFATGREFRRLGSETRREDGTSCR